MTVRVQYDKEGNMTPALQRRFPFLVDSSVALLPQSGSGDIAFRAKLFF